MPYVSEDRQYTPLAEEDIKKPAVLSFWSKQEFDLDIPKGFGNCDLCFKKGERIKQEVIKNDSAVADWWIRQEAAKGYTFNSKMSVASIATYVRKNNKLMSALKGEVEDFDDECGQACISE